MKAPLVATNFILRVSCFAEINSATQAPKELSELNFQKFYVSITQALLTMETQSFYKEKGIKPDTVWINGRIEPAQETSHAYFHLAKEDIGTFINFSKSDH